MTLQCTYFLRRYRHYTRTKSPAFTGIYTHDSGINIKLRHKRLSMCPHTYYRCVYYIGDIRVEQRKFGKTSVGLCKIILGAVDLDEVFRRLRFVIASERREREKETRVSNGLKIVPVAFAAERSLLFFVFFFTTEY